MPPQMRFMFNVPHFAPMRKLWRAEVRWREPPLARFVTRHVMNRRARAIAFALFECALNSFMDDSTHVFRDFAQLDFVIECFGKL
jgi:hypothetical protein